MLDLARLTESNRGRDGKKTFIQKVSPKDSYPNTTERKMNINLPLHLNHSIGILMSIIPNLVNKLILMDFLKLELF